MDTFIRDRILELNAKYHWSAYQLSQKSGVGQSVLSQILAYNHQPMISTLKKICNAYGLTMSEFFSELERSEEVQGYVICVKDATIYALVDGGHRKFVQHFAEIEFMI